MTSPDNNSDLRDNSGGPVADEDPRLSAAVEEYRGLLKLGTKPDRQVFVAKHAAIAEPLVECLEALDFLQTANAQLGVGDSEVSTGATDAGHNILAGTPLGDYRIIREVGRGGMGVVYEAEQLSLGRRVALKVLPFAATLDTRQLQRFKNEAQAAAQLHHQHIVPVYAVGYERGVHYYAMQFIEGQTIAAMIHELRLRVSPDRVHAEPACAASALAAELISGQWAPEKSMPANRERADSSTSPPHSHSMMNKVTQNQQAATTERSTHNTAFFRTVAALGLHAAEALEHAHEMGVLHRDVKPANLLVDIRGHLWVTDFGLAQFQGDTKLTMTGDLLGTLRYMSPEQALARQVPIDHRTDIYSLGVTLYELLTLEAAFAGHDRHELLRRIAFDEPRLPRQINKTIPVELETIVLKAMAKEADQRYATAQALAEDIRRFLEDRPIMATRPSLWQRLRKWARRHRPVVLTAAVAGVLLLITAVVALAISNRFIADERNQKSDALADAKSNLETAERQRARAERHSKTAFQAVNELQGLMVQHRLTRFPQLEQMRSELLQKAYQFYQEIIQEDDPDPAVRYETGSAYLSMTHIDRALGRWTDAKRNNHNAHQIFEKLAAEFPADRNYRQRLAETHRLMGTETDLRREVELYEQLASENAKYFRPFLALAYHHLAYLLMLDGTGRHEETERLYRQALAIQEELLGSEKLNPLVLAYTYNSLGIHLRLTVKPAAAETLHRKALELCEQPIAISAKLDVRAESARSLNHLAAALWVQNQREEAVRHASRAVAILKDQVDEFPLGGQPEELASAYNGLGQMLEVSGRRSESAEAYRLALAQAERVSANFPNRPNDRVLIGILVSLIHFQATDDPTAAKEYFRRLRELDPQDYEARNTLAWYLATFPNPAFRDARRAVELAEKSVSLSPKQGTYVNTLGVARYRADDWKSAIADLEKSRLLMNKTEDSFNTFFLAMAHWKLGNREQARQWCDQAITWMEKHKPQHPELIRFRAEAEELLGLKK